MGEINMAYRTKWGLYCIVLLLLQVLIHCTGNKRSGMPRAVIIIGDITLTRNAVTSNLQQGQVLQAGDTVKVSDRSKLKCELPGGTTWYLNNGTCMYLGEPVAVSEVKRRLPLALSRGQIHIVKHDESIDEYLVSTPQWEVRVTAADITISTGETSQQCWIAMFQGFSTFTPPEGSATVIPPCNKLLFTEGSPGELHRLQEKDIASVKSWVGQTVVEKALELSSCTAADAADENEMPRWQKLPDETAMLGEKILDTVEAVDPEQTAITYELQSGPEGMKLDPVNGALSYEAKEAGEHKVVLVAHDAGGLACTANVTITVSTNLSVLLRGPRKVISGKPVTFWAVSKGVDKKTVRYRFDMDGDGVFDIPGKRGFGRRSIIRNHTFSEEGVVRLTVEAKSIDGQRAKAKRHITVNNPPKAALKVTPDLVTLGNTVIFDIADSKDTRNGDVPLKVRYDIDGDGTWDIPKNNGFMSVPQTSFQFEKAGTFTVIAQVVDKDGASSTATAKVLVSEGLSGLSIEGPDSSNVGDSVSFICKVGTTQFPLRQYAWSFNGDATYEAVDGKNRAKNVFRQAGVFTVRCDVTDEKNQQGSATRKITVINNSALVDAGGPYTTGVNKAITLKGTGSDKDSKIIAYEWDIDGDGTADYSDKEKTDVTHTYTKSGTYTARFLIKTDDGKITVDSTRIDVTNKNPVAKAPDDIISKKNRKVKLAGLGSDADGSITLYEWDFNGDGTFDWSSKDTGFVVHVFTEFSKAVLRVHDSDGASATDTVTVIICPEGMETIKSGKFCIDTYEYPNKYKSTPRVNVTFEEAKKICSSIGKRLCTTQEWEAACSDKQKKFVYPYGRKYDVDKCNTLGNPKVKNKAATSGFFFDCKNNNGVHDMSGNVAEWTDGSTAIAQGGSWQNGKQGSRCDSKVHLKKGRKYFYVGFRCCK